jgi:TPR repeat protein
MPVVTMPLKQPNPQTILSATLRELCRYLAASPKIELSEQECAALAVAALGGHPEAEFMVGSLFDAANDPARALEWYRRSAGRDYPPALLQLFALR